MGERKLWCFLSDYDGGVGKVRAGFTVGESWE